MSLNKKTKLLLIFIVLLFLAIGYLYYKKVNQDFFKYNTLDAIHDLNLIHDYINNAKTDDPGYNIIAKRLFDRKASDMFIYYYFSHQSEKYDIWICELYLKDPVLYNGVLKSLPEGFYYDFYVKKCSKFELDSRGLAVERDSLSEK